MTGIKEHLVAILAATPEPPSQGVDPADVGDTAEVWIEERESLIESLRNEISEDYQATTEEHELLMQIQERDSRWEAVLIQARHEMFQRLKSISRLKTADGNKEY